jgi:arylamine N-acetyltransferase
LLRQIVQRFAGLPYENASELLALHERGPEPRLPEQVVEEHLESGTGATCFGLTCALEELLRCYGFEPRLHLGRAGDARPLRPFVPNHAALSVVLEQRIHLCDPGMVLHQPLQVGAPGEVQAHRGAREVTVLTQPREHGLVSELVETGSGFRQICFVDLSPLTREAYLAAWRRSFDPLLPAEFLFMSQFDGEALWTLADRFLTRRDRGGQSRRRVELLQIAGRWGLPEDLVRRAWLCTPHSHRHARIRATVRRKVFSVLQLAQRRVDYFP